MSDPSAPVSKDDTFEANSVAKGVFVFKKGSLVSGQGQEQCDDQARKKRSAKKRRSASRKRNSAKKKSRKEDEDDYDSKNPWEWTWSRASRAFAQLQGQTFGEVLDAVVSFASDDGGGGGGDGDGGGGFAPSSVRACALLTGVNLPDHDSLFRLLASKMRDKVSPHVASLRTSGSGGGAAASQRAIVRAAVGQLMLRGGGEGGDGDEEDEGEQHPLEVRGADLVLPALEAWYNNQYPESGGLRRPPLIVIFEDFEAFPAQVLQDFILNIAEYAISLPFLLVFGVATTVSAVHQKLPLHVSSYLSLETFAGQKASELMTKVVEQVLMNDEIPFKLGGKCLQLLQELFLFGDFSVKKFLLAYKFCLLEHYSRSPVIPLLCVCPDTRRRNLGDETKMSRQTLDICRSLPSFRRYVEEDVRGRAHLLTDDSAFCKILSQLLDDLDAAFARATHFAKALNALGDGLPGAPLGLRVHTTYGLCLAEGGPTRSHGYREAFQLLGHVCREDLARRLKNFRDQLEGSRNELTVKTCKEATEYLKKLEDFPMAANVTSPVGRKNSTGLTRTPARSGGKKISRTELQKQLLEQSQKQRPASPYEQLRKEVLGFLHRSVSAATCRSPARMPFHEVVSFDDDALVRRRLAAFPRGVVTAALEDPFVYLGSPGLEIRDRREISSSFPDISVAFKLHQEGGKLINLYDWLQSWLSIVRPPSAEHDGDEEDDVDDVDPVDQARFARVVSSLQFLGFVKPSRRKTDHVAKLTWGD